MPALRDPAAIRSILLADPAWSVYALGDLAPGLFERCEWFQPATGVPALALVYRGFSTSVLFAIGEPSALVPALDELSAEPVLYLQVRPEIMPLIEARFQLIERKEMLRMVLDPRAYRPAPAEGAVRLSHADLGELQRLYSGGQATGEAPDFFLPSMLADGVFYGIREKGELVAAAGTHLAVPAEGVGVLGNIYTRRDRRGRGLAARSTSAVVSELLRMNLATIALNVALNNQPAIRVYERLGFRHYCVYYEGRAKRR
jgi:ribosomal protein S18 acetylase RimI-like enzyme